MRIGLISAEKHCKTHIQGLRSDGYDVTCLGARPTSIPPSYDALIVRVASSSHGGEATARSWMRETGKPAIYEDGLTGIRRELKRLVLDVAVPQRKEDLPKKVCCSEIQDDLAACAKTYVEARPYDTQEDLSKALRAVLYKKYPDQADRCLSIVPALVATYHTHMESSVTPSAKTNIYPATRGDLPTDQKWAATYSVNRMRTVYDNTNKLIDNMPPDARDAFLDIYMQCDADPTLDFRTLLWGSVTARHVFFRKGGRSIFDAKPMDFIMFVMLLSSSEDAMQKRPFFTSYKSLTSKGNDSRLPDAVAWFLGLPEPLNAPSVIGNRVEAPKVVGAAPETNSEPVQATVSADTVETNSEPVQATVSADTVESNTEAILTLMDDVSKFRNEIQADVSQIGAGLQETIGYFESRIKALEERVTQVRLDQIPDSNIGSRIKALEVGASETLRQAQTGARMAVEEMREELRSDIFDAFDALAAEQPSGDVSSNPLAALEQVKAALKAAGFKGTLTLTIE